MANAVNKNDSDNVEKTERDKPRTIALPTELSTLASRAGLEPTTHSVDNHLQATRVQNKPDKKHDRRFRVLLLHYAPSKWWRRLDLHQDFVLQKK
jgi:hypothetical protein